jgi:asparagine synthase (glutamine-hydrolysing)
MPPDFFSMHSPVQVEIIGRTGSVMQIAQDFWLLGTIYDGTKKCEPFEMRKRILACESSESIASLLRNLGGFFSLVFRHSGDRVFAVTDRGRTHPLLYTNQNGRFIISDTPQRLLSALPAPRLDLLAAGEFATAGFVSGDRTLVEGIRSIGPATMLRFDPEGTCTSICYREFVPNLALSNPDDFELHAARLEDALRQSVARLVDYADGRTLILPLSGGVDSRALFACLLESGYPKIKAFTFGRAWSSDYRVGAEIASASGIPFKAVPYSRSRWRAMWNDPRFGQYLAHAHGLTSVPNLQAVPALIELRESGWVEPDAVFVPALAGFFPGGCLPSAAAVEGVVGNGVDYDRLLDALMQRHFRTSNLKRVESSLQARFREQLRALSEAHPSLAAANPVERMVLLSEAMEYHERQAKFIGNACRYFDSQGYDWWLPMWDAEFVSACESLPIDLRRDKRLLKVVTTRFERRYPKRVGSPPEFVVNGGFVKNAQLRAMTGYFLDPFGQFAIVPFFDWFARVYGRAPAGGTVIDVLAKRCLYALESVLGSSKS